MVGSAIGADVAYLIYVPAHFWICKRLIGLPVRPVVVTFARTLVAAAAMALAMLAFGYNELSVLDWFAGGPAGVATYVLPCCSTGEVDRSELASVRRGWQPASVSPPPPPPPPPPPLPPPPPPPLSPPSSLAPSPPPPLLPTPSLLSLPPPPLPSSSSSPSPLPVPPFPPHISLSPPSPPSSSPPLHSLLSVFTTRPFSSSLSTPPPYSLLPPSPSSASAASPIGPFTPPLLSPEPPPGRPSPPILLPFFSPRHSGGTDVGVD